VVRAGGLVEVAPDAAPPLKHKHAALLQRLRSAAPPCQQQ
jgi:hypothetical protein